MVKFRNAQSYYGRTEQAKKRQRGNLIPGGSWQKKRIKELRLDCWWECMPLVDMQWVFEKYINERYFEDVPAGELKSEEYLDNWWGELSLEDRKDIKKILMANVRKESRSEIFKNVEKCLKEKLALLEKKE